VTEIAGFSLKNRNPDVLTSIANLSNDEVFTPPSFANQMLDTIAEAWAKNNKGASIWEDKTVTFLDPFTKSGVFLREITRRLSKGLEKQIPDVQERVNHILTKQVFGVAITELTSLLARRSLYCSKYSNGKHSICTEFDTPDGNIWFERTEHTWVGGKEKVITVDDEGKEIEVTLDGTCKFCGAKQKEYERGLDAESHAYALIHTDDPKEWVKNTFGEDMRFDVIVGNPPYQLSDGGGGSSASPIYQKFVQQAQALDPRLLTMVIPARWYSGGKGLDAFREKMLSDGRIRYLADYKDSRESFSGVDVAGGICFFLWDASFSGLCQVESFSGGSSTVSNRKLNEFDTLVRDFDALELLRRVLEQDFTPFSQHVNPRNFFGIPSAQKPEKVGALNFISSLGDGKIPRISVKKNLEVADKWKVILSKTSSEHAGQTAKDGSKRVLSRIEVAGPGTVCSESYLVLGPFASESECENVVSYLRTRFFRFMLSLRLLTQNISSDSFSFVPALNFDQSWSDSAISDHFGLKGSEIELIQRTIRSMDSEDA
jgi:hypothetical protein